MALKPEHFAFVAQMVRTDAAMPMNTVQISR